MSNAQIIAGGLAVPDTTRVATDQSSILGDGSAQNPLRAGSSGATLHVTIESIGTPPLGTPMQVTALAPVPPSVTTVSQASGVDTIAKAQCIGLLVSLDPSLVQLGGIVELTIAEWDAVGTSGGLTQGDTYYLDASGLISASPPGTPGDWSSQVGIALSSTQLLLTTPSVPLAVA